MVGTFKEGITIEDFDSRDEKLKLVSRSDLPPVPKEIKESLPFVQGEYDFSNVLGETFYENRTVRYLFYQRYNDYPIRKINKIHLQNKLLTKHNVKIFDTAIPGYYYWGKVSKANVTDVHTKHRLEVEIELDCYPYMISELPEGHDVWDEFNFELDVVQQTNFSTEGEYTFKELLIGSTATIGAWATTFASGGGKIPIRNIGISGTIQSVENVSSSRSKRAYEVSGIDGLVVEQDIIQAHNNPLEVLLINSGTSSISPSVDLTAKATIVKDGRSYNFIEGGNYTNEDFRLENGENKLLIYSFHENEISFDFHKELI